MCFCKLDELVLVVWRNFLTITVSNIFVDFAADNCYNDGAISRNNNSVVTACFNGYNTSVCSFEENSYPVAVAACNSEGLEYYCK